MRLIHTRRARSIWLFDIRDLNPKGKDILGDLVSWIKDAYSFTTAPDPDNPLPNGTPSVKVTPQAIPPPPPQGLVFTKGRFQAQEEIYVGIENLTIYDDGIVIDATSTTEEGDQFAANLLKSATEEFALAYDPDMVQRRMYVSELIVRSEINLEHLNPKLAAFSAKIAEASREGTFKASFATGGISFWSDMNNPVRQKVFRIERQAGKAFSENRYFADAPMPTSVHLSLLDDLEKLVIGK